MKATLRRLTKSCIVLWWRGDASMAPWWTSWRFVTLCGRAGAVAAKKGITQALPRRATGSDAILGVSAASQQRIEREMERYFRSNNDVPGVWEPGTPTRRFGLEYVGECYTGEHEYIPLVPVDKAKCEWCQMSRDVGFEKGLIRLPSEGGPYRVTRGIYSGQKPHPSWWKDGLFVGPPVVLHSGASTAQVEVFNAVGEFILGRKP